jgi:[acyl-carrier-protein] S-malonyltransferase
VGCFGGALVSRIAFLFPGQGSQASGMGRELAGAYPESREVFEAADRVLERPLAQTCFEGSAEELALTETTQPAILTVSVAALRALQSRGVRPAATAGHSLGEYSAHVAAGTFAFEDAVRAVRLRGRFMQQAVPAGDGAMAAILGLEGEVVERLCAESAGDQVVSPANWNARGQVVIAGHAAAVKRAVQAARDAGAKRAVPLSVSAPFHCALMRPAAEQLRPVLESIQFAEPAIPVYTNVDAAPVTEGAAAREALLRQVDHPVRWHEAAQAMVAAGFDTFVEAGPGRVLSGLMRRVAKDLRVMNVADPDGVEQAVKELGES